MAEYETSIPPSTVTPLDAIFTSDPVYAVPSWVWLNESETIANVAASPSIWVFPLSVSVPFLLNTAVFHPIVVSALMSFESILTLLSSVVALKFSMMDSVC